MPVLPATLMASLKTVPNPVLPRDPVSGANVLRPDLEPYVANLQAAIQLGKAFFWDMQAGSDDRTACATCHHQAGADVRSRNQIAPGPNRSWSPLRGANATLSGTNFPFTDAYASPQVDTDNIAGSQGVRKKTFKSLNSKTGDESTADAVDALFNVKGTNVRQVTSANAPTVLNAVFNHRQFHNGRSQPDFNGVNHLGYRDPLARVWSVGTNGAPFQIDIKIPNAGLASQATAPVLNDQEMSATGRTFLDIAAKLLLRKPLGLQKVSPTDSVLGPLAATGSTPGLTTTYAAMIQKAFKPAWWNSTKNVTINKRTATLIQANFAMFWGISIMLYEATLVSDESPMDRYLATRVFSTLPDGTLLCTSNPSLLDPVVARLAARGLPVTRDAILQGLALFELPVAPSPSFPVQRDPTTGAPRTGAGCIACHVGAETTSASIRNLTGPGIEPGDVALKSAGFDLRMERMFSFLGFDPRGPLAPVPLGTDTLIVDTGTYTVKVAGMNGMAVSPAIQLPVVTYDVGWYNLGVRPNAEDPGLGGVDPSGMPLSWTEYLQKTLPNPSVIKVPGGGLASPCTPPSAPAGTPFHTEVLNPFTGMPVLAGGLLKNEATGVAGSFKTASLRNVELTGPYFHNGGKSTLGQVIEFYDSGGDFDNPTKSPLLVPLMLGTEQARSLISFLVSLTDERVLFEKAPFDHPQISLPNGAADAAPGTDVLLDLPAVGAAGRATPCTAFLGLNPFSPLP